MTIPLIGALVLSFSSWVSAASCTVSLPIEDVQVIPDVEGSFTYGISASIGTPPQNIVVLPWSELNDTWIYDSSQQCNTALVPSDTACRVRRGNYFWENISTTFNRTANVVEAKGSAETYRLGAEDVDGLANNSFGGTDVFSLGPGVANLTQYPIGLPQSGWDHGVTFQHALGMGSNSTYLNSLVEAGRIASRVWAIFWGRMWVGDPVKGSVVFGGYDTAKVAGPNYTQALDFTAHNLGGCWTGMKVYVTDIRFYMPTGGSKSVFGNGLALPFCIVPQRQLLMEGPGWIRDSFDVLSKTQSMGNSTGVHYNASVYNANNYFKGDVEITLSTGLAIRIANDQFMVPAVNGYPNGTRYLDQSKREFLVGSTSWPQPATLGRYFLTGAYLMVNHDAGEFTLWKANPTATADLVSIVKQGKQWREVKEGQGVLAGSTGSCTLLPKDSKEKIALSLGAIGSISAGGALVLFLLVAIIVVLARRSKAANKALLGGAEDKLRDTSPTSSRSNSQSHPINPYITNPYGANPYPNPYANHAYAPNPYPNPYAANPYPINPNHMSPNTPHPTDPSGTIDPDNPYANPQYMPFPTDGRLPQEVEGPRSCHEMDGVPALAAQHYKRGTWDSSTNGTDTWRSWDSRL